MLLRSLTNYLTLRYEMTPKYYQSYSFEHQILAFLAHFARPRP